MSSFPYATGDGMLDGAMCLEIVWNICPTNPPGVQFAMAIIPPGRAHALKFRRHQLRPRREHRSDQTDRRVKLMVRVWQ